MQASALAFLPSLLQPHPAVVGVNLLAPSCLVQVSQPCVVIVAAAVWTGRLHLEVQTWSHGMPALTETW